MIIEIKVPIYRTVCWVYVGDDEEKYRAHYVKKVGYGQGEKDLDLTNSDALGRTICHSSRRYFVRLFQNARLGVIAHEFSHVAFSILWDVGVTISEHSEESFTYLLTYLINSYETQLNKSKEKLARTKT